MIVACLGWGSLCWDPGSLPVVGKWQQDGPSLRVEFARQSGTEVSDNGPITLVLVDSGPACAVLWAKLDLLDLNAGVEALAKRERIKGRNIERSIGRWQTTTDPLYCHAEEIANWAKSKALNGVVRTAPPYGMKRSRRTMPELKQILHITFRSFEVKTANIAVNYIKRAPSQIVTRFRKELEAAVRAVGA